MFFQSCSLSCDSNIQFSNHRLEGLPEGLVVSPILQFWVSRFVSMFVFLFWTILQCLGFHIGLWYPCFSLCMFLSVSFVFDLSVLISVVLISCVVAAVYAHVSVLTLHTSCKFALCFQYCFVRYSDTLAATIVSVQTFFVSFLLLVILTPKYSKDMICSTLFL